MEKENNQQNPNQNEQVNNQSYPEGQQYYQNYQGYPYDQQYYQNTQGYPDNQQYYQNTQDYSNGQQYYQNTQWYPDNQQYYQNTQGYPNGQQYYQNTQGYPDNQQYYQNYQNYPDNQQYYQPPKDTTPAFKDKNGNVPPKKKNFKPYIGLIAGIILAIILIVVIVKAVTGKRTINLEDFLVEPEYSGYSGMGNAYSGGINETEFLEKYEDVIEYTNKVNSSSTDSGIDIYYYKRWGESAAEALYDCYISSNVRLDAASDLSNGDTVTYTFDFTEEELEEIEEYFNVKLKYDEDGVSFTVTGLEEIKSVDVFANIDVTYSGVAPNGSISSVKNSTYDYIDYEYTPTSGLSNGSTVTISISDDDIEYLTENYGVIPNSTSTEITVEGLDSYATSLSQIPEETMNKLKSQSEDVIDSYVASTWESYVTLENKTYLGCYFLTPKDTSSIGVSSWLSSGSPVYIYMVYKLQVHEYVKGELNNTFEYYYFVKFENPIILADGTCSIDTSDYETSDGWDDDSNSFTREIDYSTSEWYDTTTLTYIGYENLDSMFNNCVTQRVADYNYESTVEEQ